MKKKLLCVILLPLGLLAGFLLPAFMPFSGTDPGSGNGFSAQSTAKNSHEAETVRTDAVSGSLEEGPSEESKEEREVEKPAIPAERPLEEIPFDGQLAHQYLTELCAIGPRPSGSEGMKKQQE